MSIFSMRRLGGIVTGAFATVVAGALPASALGIGVNLLPTPVVHVEDCRSASMARQAAYGFDFSSQTTGPKRVQVGVAADASIDLCWSLDVNALSSVQVSTVSDLSVDGLVSGLLYGTDASKVCTTIHLKVAPGVKGTVTANAHAHVLVDGAPPLDWNDTLTRNTVVDGIGEDITLKMCADTSGNVSAS
jgi:hypothetical protein